MFDSGTFEGERQRKATSDVIEDPTTRLSGIYQLPVSDLYVTVQVQSPFRCTRSSLWSWHSCALSLEQCSPSFMGLFVVATALAPSAGSGVTF